ncbi:MAG: aromatic amino acid transport family protein [Patescibacteria group bacterium]
MYTIAKYPHLLTIGSLAGTIIGVGMFGIPYVTTKAGIIPVVFYLALFTVVSILVHAMYMEITLRTKEKHRLSGYSGIYLGNKWKWATLIQTIIFLWGSLLIYTIIGGQFINIAFKNFFGDATIISSVIFFFIASYIVVRGIKTIGKADLIFTIIISIAVILFFLKTLSIENFENILKFAPINWENIIMPYGIILFSMTGLSIIPALEDEVDGNIALKQRIHFGKIIGIGTVIPAFIYLLFTFSVVEISGTATSQDALSGLSSIGDGYLMIGAIIGAFAILTSFIALGNELRRTFIEDFNVSVFWSTIATFVAPLVLFLLGLNDFIIITSFIGAFGAIYINLIIFIMHRKAKKMGDEKKPIFSFNVPKSILLILSIIFVIGFFISIMELI